MTKIMVGHFFIDGFVEEPDKHGGFFWRKDFSATKCPETENCQDVAVLRKHLATFVPKYYPGMEPRYDS